MAGDGGAAARASTAKASGGLGLGEGHDGVHIAMSETIVVLPMPPASWNGAEG